MSFYGATDWFTEVSKGNIPGHVRRFPYGFHPSMEAGAGIEDIWSAADNTIDYLTAAETMDVVSDSASDTSAGTGAQTVKLEGLDGNYDEITEIVTMNGLTPVVTTSTFLRVLRTRAESAGALGGNAGNISVDATTSGSSQAHMRPLVGFAQGIHYTVPNLKRGLLYGFSVNATKTGGSALFTMALVIRELGKPFIILTEERETSDDPSFSLPFGAPLLLATKTDLKITGDTDKNGLQIYATFSIIEYVE